MEGYMNRVRMPIKPKFEPVTSRSQNSSLALHPKTLPKLQKASSPKTTATNSPRTICLTLQGVTERITNKFTYILVHIT